MNSIDPNIWGPSAWALIHIVSFYVSNNKDIRAYEQAKRLYQSMLHMLPCHVCRNNLRSHLSILDYPKEAKDLPQWAFALHNRVSDMKGKKEAITFVEAKKKWSNTPLSWKLIAPFVHSISQTHPSARSINLHTRDAFYDFFDSLLYFMKSKERMISKEDIASRYALKQWLQRICKKNGVDICKPILVCQDACHM